MNKPSKILLLIDNLNTGGAQRQLCYLAIGLRQKGYSVGLATYTHGNDYANTLGTHGIQLFHPSRSQNPVLKLYATFATIRRFEPAIVCAFLMTPGLVALLSKLFLGVPYVAVSERIYESFLTDWSKPFTRLLYPFSNAIVCNSISQALLLQEKFPRLRKRVHYVPNCVDLLTFSPETLAHDPGCNVLSVGRIVHYKNTHILIEALELVIKFGFPQAKVRWIGRSQEHAGQYNKYFSECCRLIKEKHLDNHWEWVEPGLDIVEQYRKADILVHPSVGEGFPNVIGEALACGCPVIAGRVLDHPHIVKQGVNGLLFIPGNSLSLATQIAYFFSLSVNHKLHMRSNCRQTAETEFKPEKMVSAYSTLFSSGKPDLSPSLHEAP